MKEILALGIDCGGTHTDAALLAVNAEERQARVLASCKVATRHEDLASSVTLALEKLGCSKQLAHVERVTLGATLAINAIVQNRADRVGLALAAGPGLDPRHFTLGDNVCIVPGSLDHRGVEIEKLHTEGLKIQARKWAETGVKAIACVSKFSPRNPGHEIEMAEAAAKASGLPVCMGHSLSGELNFPRRIATAYYNAAVGNLSRNFLDAVEKAFQDFGLNAQYRLLKADGGAIPFGLARREPVQTILAGPAASVMGVMALWEKVKSGCALMLDIGGTTTDIAVFLDGSPVVDRQGMKMRGRHTLVHSLATISIAIGGDSLLGFTKDADGQWRITVGPMRVGPATAFGGSSATLLDALNALDGENSDFECGDVAASVAAMQKLAGENWMEAAEKAVQTALAAIMQAVADLAENINNGPIYTLAALKAAHEARPEKVCVVGGPAQCLQARLEQAMLLPVEAAPKFSVANAIGAALTVPTASLEIYADTRKGRLMAPAINYEQKIGAGYSLQEAKAQCRELLRLRLEAEGVKKPSVEVIEADMFAVLDDSGRGSRDIRVCAQVRPDIIAAVKA